jgi:hypothetical protein
MPLFAITGPPPDDVEVTILAPTPLLALSRFHAEALGQRAVHPRNGGLWFRYREDQELCAGTWTVTRQAMNGDASASVTIEIPPPD